jgi:hypothetical protein
MKLAAMHIEFEGDDLTPEFEATLERFEERLEELVDGVRADLPPDVQVRVSDR